MGALLSSLFKHELNTGSILDRVISEASNEDDCLLYRLANYKKGGEVIDSYNTGGQSQVEKLIREQFPLFMYNDGKGQTVNRSEYLRWRFRNQNQVVLPIEACLSRHDPLGKWYDHEACWQMQYRGSLGESLLHVLIICDTKIHTKLARLLLKHFPRLSIDCVEGEEYLGASALHLAIAYNNNELVQDLVEAGASVNQRAIGSFFLPRDQQRRHPARHTDYEGLAYLGEYPLSWAACCANETVYNLLLDNGANPDMQDSFGNMILHMVVVGDKLDMFGYALRHPKVPARNGILNNAGLTPLALACTLGRASVFREMLELSAREFWRYSNITCSAYPLNALDTLLPDGRTNWNSALLIILNGTKQEHLDMLDGGIIQRLLEEKWKMFARRQFLKRLGILFLHLFLLSMAIYLRPAEKDEPLLGSLEWNHIVRYSFEVGTVVGVLFYIVIQQGGEMINQGALSFIRQLPNEPAKAIFLTSNVLILLCIPFRLIGDKQSEEAILVFAVPGSWFLLMFFAGAVRLTGPFITMVYLMITGDMLTFGMIYSIILFGFSQTFYFMYKGSPEVEGTLFSSYSSTWMGLFQITLGDFDYTVLGTTVYPSLSKTVFAMFMVFVPILLLNMLIAMMGNTYAHVIEQSEKEWMKQWAKVVVAMERAVNQKDAQRYLQEYSIKLGPGDDPSTEQRGVLVIKSKNKTRAKQRKGAVTNWKRVGKVTINELKKRGMSGEQLRRLMWGRESISTPVRSSISKCNTTDIGNDMTNVNSPFMGALSAALDVMAFSNEIDFSKKVMPESRKVSNSSMIISDISDDPFRQLVLTSDNPKAKEKELSTLAAAAAKCVEESEEVCKQKSLLNAFTSNILTVQQEPSFMEQSDSDSFSKEHSLLGQRSRAQRSKSAHIKNSRSGRTRSLSSTAILKEQKNSPYIDMLESCSNSSFEYCANINSNIPSKSETNKLSSSPDQSFLEVKYDELKVRPKTARNNRVAPMLDVSRRGSSAVRTSENEFFPNSFDPLKPWSTRGIKNLHTILFGDHSDEENL